MRIGRVIEGSQTAAVLVGAERIARSPGGVTIALDASSPEWSGSRRSRPAAARLTLRPRVVGGKI